MSRRTQKRGRKPRPYVGGFGQLVRTVDDDEWVSQWDAADALGASMWRLALLIGAWRVEPVHNAERHAGVSAGSLDEEARRRQNTTLVHRLALLLADISSMVIAYPRGPFDPRKRGRSSASQ